MLLFCRVAGTFELGRRRGLHPWLKIKRLNMVRKRAYLRTYELGFIFFHLRKKVVHYGVWHLLVIQPMVGFLEREKNMKIKLAFTLLLLASCQSCEKKTTHHNKKA